MNTAMAIAEIARIILRYELNEQEVRRIASVLLLNASKHPNHAFNSLRLSTRELGEECDI